MHGRLKIKTTAEQQEAKRIEREKKLKLYKAGTSKIFEKRKNEEYDEEALSLTGDFLQQNPDFYTLWNFRKEILLHLKPQKTEDEVQALGSNELDLTQHCLKTNPKSYGAWHHRIWSLNFMPQPNWIKELKLCDFFLSIDERNFHCWDYRRQVCKNCCVKSEDELKFTINLIEKNFSNYSAWHYRSALLPIVHPGSGYIAVAEETLLKEYETVQNAAFTDPNDQSVWFYHRWLLGRGNRSSDMLSLAVLNEICTVIVSFASPVQVNSQGSLCLTVNENEAQVVWKPVYNDVTVSNVWYCEIPNNFILSQESTKVCVQFKNGMKTDVIDCTLNGNFSYSRKSKDNSTAFCSDVSAATKDVLEKELESCQQLYELEPNNKWVLFTTVLLMKAIDSQKYQNEILSHLEDLIFIDKMRQKYYEDLRSKFLIENVIETMPVDVTDLCLANQRLSSLYHFDYFILMRKVDLSHNNLTSVRPLQYLLCVQELILNNNKLENCNDIKNLPLLEKLLLQNNNISKPDDLQALTSCHRLKYLSLCGNPLTNDSAYDAEIETLLDNVKLDK